MSKINNRKKKFLIILFSSILLVLSVFAVISYINYSKEKELEAEKINKENLLKEINSSYNKYVKTNKDSKLYVLESGKYNEIGSVKENVELELNDIQITYETQYFHIKGLDYYISYKDVEKIDTLSTKDVHYKEYVVFNENVLTTNPTKFYSEDNLVYTIDKEFDLPIIIKDIDKYYVEYNNELFFVKKDNVKEVKESNNSSEEVRTNIRTLTYHTIYNTETEKCTNTVICHPIEQFDSHMKYLSENDYFTLTMEDLELFLDEKIQIPKKSVVITLDDGKYAINAVNIVEKYKVNATYFIITGRYEIPDVETTYMNFESHTDNMHNNWKCSGGNQGGELLCADENKILEDLKNSQEKLGGSTAFAYPFFDFNERAINLLKQAGFKLAFIGQYDTDGYSYPYTDKMKLRRKTIFSSDSIEKFISYLK